MITDEVRATLVTEYGEFTYFRLADMGKMGLKDPKDLPFSIKILLESALRNCDGFKVTLDDVRAVAEWSPRNLEPKEIAFNPGRVILQDFTGVPCVVDLAAMRGAVQRLGGDITKINPQVRCDLIIDHSLQVDVYGCPEAYAVNMDKEFARNRERYEFLKWGQNVFQNFSVVPPGKGIIHQVNLEHLAQGVLRREANGETVIYPDSLVGTDSHTTMINGLGIVGWGVGGIEAEAVMLGDPVTMPLPEVVGVKLTGRLNEGVTATDLVLTIVERLRQKGVVGKFVEYFGDGIRNLSLPDRAMISNMAPEYGATIGIFPVDETTLEYYAMTGRDPKQIDLIEQYMRTQGLFYIGEDPDVQYSDIVEVDLSGVEASLAGPRRPQDRINLREAKEAFQNSLTAPVEKAGFGLSEEHRKRVAHLPDGERLANGSVVIASITSCTTTSNPSVLMAAGLLARKAVEKGLKVASFVKTSLAPGSQVVEDYLSAAGLLPYLEKLGFYIVGYGCATCIGNSGPLNEDVVRVICENDLVAASVLSGNRNFEGRISPHTRANYLASPPLVVAYALAGTVDIDFTTEPIGQNDKGKDVFLKDIWPSDAEIKTHVDEFVITEAFRRRYNEISAGTRQWDAVQAGTQSLFAWDQASTYIQELPFFEGMKKQAGKIREIKGARVLVKVGDSITTDHISPAGAIAKDSPAGIYLKELGVEPRDFNSYGARRGNDRVMARGTFANIRLRNQLVPASEGSWTVHFPSGKEMSIYDAAQEYVKKKIPLIILAGKEYGTGSSRDWAAKGPALLGVRAVIAETYERIHRSNLAGMGIVPLQFLEGDSAQRLGLTGEERYDFKGLTDGLQPQDEITVTATDARGRKKCFTVICRLDTPVEIEYCRNGGILQTVIRKLL